MLVISTLCVYVCGLLLGKLWCSGSFSLKKKINSLSPFLLLNNMLPSLSFKHKLFFCFVLLCIFFFPKHEARISVIICIFLFHWVNSRGKGENVLCLKVSLFPYKALLISLDHHTHHCTTGLKLVVDEERINWRRKASFLVP